MYPIKHTKYIGDTRRKRDHLKTRGAGLILVVIIAGILGSVLASYLTYVIQQNRSANRLYLSNAALNLTESGLEFALYTLQEPDAFYSSPWQTVSPNVFYAHDLDLHLPISKMTPKIHVLVDNRDPKSTFIFVETEVARSKLVTKKQVMVELGSRGGFDNGLTTKNGIRMNGNKVTLTSYDSDEGVYDPNNFNDNCSVASSSVQVDAIDIQNADIWGYVATGGGLPRLGKQGSVVGFDSPAGVQIDTSRVTADFYAEFFTPSVPDLGPFPTSTFTGTVGHPCLETTVVLDELDMGNGDAVIIHGDVTLIVEKDIDMSGTASISVAPGSTLTIYTGGDIDITGNGIVNTNKKSTEVLIYGTNEERRNIRLAGNGALYAGIYAPNSNVELKGSGSLGVFEGAVVAYNVVLTGNYEFRYDEALERISAEDRKKVIRWVETYGSDRVDISSIAAISAWL